MTKCRMTRHIKNSFNDIGLEELRRSVYDYTSYYYQTTYPDRDATVFCRENMLSPFSSIHDKVTAIIGCLRLYWRGLDKGYNEILDIVKQESLLGQAIYLIARKNVNNDDVKMTFDIDLQEIPIVFGDLMILYMQSGYDVRNLKEFLIELYDEYYPKVYPSEKHQDLPNDEENSTYPRITEEDLDIDIRNNLFDFLDNLRLAYESDRILSKFIYRSPDHGYMKNRIDKLNAFWMQGVHGYNGIYFTSCDDKSNIDAICYPIIDASFIFKFPNNNEFDGFAHAQVEAITSRVIRECSYMFPDTTDFKDVVIEGLNWNTSLLKKTDTIMIEVFIHHSDCISILDTPDSEEENINGSIVNIRVSILGE